MNNHREAYQRWRNKGDNRVLLYMCALFWNYANRDRVNELARIRYRKNPKKKKLSHAQWRKRHPDTCNLRIVKRRAILLGSKIGDQKKVVKIYARAAELRQWFNVAVDHVIPLCRGGKHEASNLQIIYARENSIKGTRLDYTPSVIFV